MPGKGVWDVPCAVVGISVVVVAVGAVGVSGGDNGVVVMVVLVPATVGCMM